MPQGVGVRLPPPALLSQEKFMQLDFSNEGKLEGVLTLSIEQEDYQEKLSSALKSYQKSMSFPGFRKGKTPLGLVKKQLGSDVKKEEVNKLIQSEISTYYQENREKIIFMPLMNDLDDDFDWGTTNSFNFSFRVAMKPEFEINKEVLKKVESHELKLTDEELEKEIQNLRKQYGDVEKIDEVQDHPDMVTVFRVTELDEEGNDLKDGFTKTVRLEAKDLTKAWKDVLLGKKNEEEFTCDIKKAVPVKELESTLEVDKNTVKDFGDSFKVSIQGSILLKEAEMNEEFYQKVFNVDTIKDEESFRARISENLSGFFAGKDQRQLQSKVKETLLEEVEIDLPEAFMKAWYERNANLGEEDVLEDKVADFMNTTRWDLILENLAQEYKVGVEEEEIRNSIRSYVIQQYAYQMAGLDQEQVENMVNNLYGQEYFRLELRQNILENKVVSELKKSSTFTQVQLSKPEFEEFVKENEL